MWQSIWQRELSLQLSFGPIGWLMISEVFPLRLRGRGLGVAVLVNFASNALVTFAFSPLEVRAYPVLLFFSPKSVAMNSCHVQYMCNLMSVDDNCVYAWCRRIWLERGRSSLDSGWLQWHLLYLYSGSSLRQKDSPWKRLKRVCSWLIQTPRSFVLVSVNWRNWCPFVVCCCS